MPIEVIRGRAEALIKLNLAFYKLFKFVNHKFRLDESTNHGKHYAMRDYVVPTLRYKLIKRELLDVVKIDKRDKPEINLQETDPS